MSCRAGARCWPISFRRQILLCAFTALKVQYRRRGGAFCAEWRTLAAIVFAAFFSQVQRWRWCVVAEAIVRTQVMSLSGYSGSRWL